MLKLSDFCVEHNVKHNTISNYMKNHEKEFKGHTQKLGNRSILLDDIAVEILSRQYPSIDLKPDIITNSNEYRELLEENNVLVKKLAERELRLKDKEIELLKAIADKEKNELLLEMQKNELTSEQKRLEESQNALRSAQEQIEFLRSELDLEKRASEDLRKRGLIARIFNKI